MRSRKSCCAMSYVVVFGRNKLLIKLYEGGPGKVREKRVTYNFSSGGILASPGSPGCLLPRINLGRGESQAVAAQLLLPCTYSLFLFSVVFLRGPFVMWALHSILIRPQTL